MMAIMRLIPTTSEVPESFAALCKSLYGDAVDPAVVFVDVVKMSPDQADLNATGQRRAKIRRNVERGSNALGLTAAGMATGAALRDDRFKEGGKVAQKLYRTGQRIPSPIASRGGKVGAALAGGALAVQGANMAGDALIAGTLGKKPDKEKTSKAAGTGSIRPMVDGLKAIWSGSPAPAAAGPKAGTRAAAKTKPMQGPKARSGASRAGEDVGRSLKTTTGKITAGVAGTAALSAGSKKYGEASGRGPQLTYVPDQYAKADVEFEVAGEFTKFDDSKRQAFGWASVVEIDGEPVVDRQDDYISELDLEDAAYRYVHKSRVGGDMHRRNGEEAHKVSDMIESMVFTKEKIEKLGLPSNFPVGWWVGYQIHDEDTWANVKKRSGFSIHGKGIRKDVDLDELTGQRR